MKKVFCLISAFFLLSIGGCESADSEVASKELDLDHPMALVDEGKIPQKIVEIEELPIWLQEPIDDTVRRGLVTPLWVFQFTWKGNIHYSIYHRLCNGLIDVIYTQDGERIEGRKREIWNDIKANSSDWSLIYEHL